MLDPWRLTLLVRLSDLGTVHAVARASHLSPSTVSHQLRTLEREAGAELLQRSGRRLLLTPAGTQLVRSSRLLLEQLDALAADLGAPRSTPVGVVRVAAFTSALRTFVTPAVRALRAAHPDLEVEISELEPHASVPALLRGELEIAVTAADEDAPTPAPAEVTLDLLGRDSLVLVAATGSPALPLTELAAASWACESSDTYLARLTVALCGRAGFSPRIGARFASYDALLDWVAADLGVTVLPGLAVRGAGDTRTVRTTPIPGAPRVSVRTAVRTLALPTLARSVVLAELRRQAALVLEPGGQPPAPGGSAPTGDSAPTGGSARPVPSRRTA